MTAADAPLVVTGAAGAVGAATVAAARAAGWAVRALVRRRAGPLPWDGDPGVETVAADLAGPDARAALDRALDGARAAIHAAGRLSGDDAAQARDVVGPTASLLDALSALPAPPPLVLVGSLAVYGYAALPAWATLDETVPLESDPALRDPYARGKLAQERLAMRAVQTRGLRVRVLRVGAVTSARRIGLARLGFAAGPLLLVVGGAAPVPAVRLEDVARALVAAAAAPPGPSDLPAPAGGGYEAINVVAPEAPTQAAALAAARRAGLAPRLTLRAPARPLRLLAEVAGLAAALLAPRLAPWLPAPLRAEAFDARFKPLRYSAARLEDRLGLVAAPPFADPEAR